MKLHNNYKLIFNTPADGYSYFCGYYDYDPICHERNLILCHKVDFDGRPVCSDDYCQIIAINIISNEVIKLGQSYSFNWQQGARLMWYNDDCLYNTRCQSTNELKAYLINIKNQKCINIYDHPFYDVCVNANIGVSLDFDILESFHPGYGYLNKAKSNNINIVNTLKFICLLSGKIINIININDIIAKLDGINYRSKIWFDHCKFNHSGSKIMFFVSYDTDVGNIESIVFISDIYFRNIKQLPYNKFFSHYSWKNDNELLIWTRPLEDKKIQFKLRRTFSNIKNYIPFRKSIKRFKFSKSLSNYTYRTFPVIYSLQNKELISSTINIPKFTGNGHTTFINNNVFLNDTYEDSESYRYIMIHSENTNETDIVSKVYSNYNSSIYRCDLHPRYNKKKNLISFDHSENKNRAVSVIKHV